MRPDRHGRSARTLPDRKRRPVDGFRLLSSRRFAEMVADILATMPEPVGSALRGARVRTVDVPPADAALTDGWLPVVRVRCQAGRATEVEIYRRTLETRSMSRLDLAELLQISIAREAATALGLELGEEWDDR
jgi:hypothetical protein